MSQDLAGVRVVSLALNLPGPLAAARLRELGAEVVKIESPTGDPVAAVVPSWYAELTRGQDVRRADLKSDAGAAELRHELGAADVLITSMRPSALRRLGLADLSDFPTLSHIEIIGYDGDRAEEAGHDLTYQADYGTLAVDAMPTIPTIDMLGAERAVWQTLLALRERDRTGRGSVRRVVLDHAAADAGAAVRHGLLGDGAPLGGADPAYAVYRAADGHVAVAAIEPHFRTRLVAELGVSDREGLADSFAAHDIAHWLELAERIDVPITRVRAVSATQTTGEL